MTKGQKMRSQNVSMTRSAALTLVLFLSFASLSSGHVSETFIKTIDNMFRSNPLSQIGNIQTLAAAHDNRIKQLRSSKEHKIRHTFLLRLIDDCGQVCHDPLQAKFKALDNLADYRILSHDVVQLTTTMKNIDDVMSSYLSTNNHILEYVSLLPHIKLDKDVQERMLSTINEESQCFEYTVVVAPLSADEIDAFSKKVENLKKAMALSQLNTFDFHASDLLIGERSYLRFYMQSLSKNEKCSTASDKQMLESVSQMPEVTWIEIRPEYKTLNRWARGNIQTGTWNNEPIYAPSTAIDGTGEIVGVADTGIDMLSCYFHDQNNSPPFNKVNMNHRKVVFYSSQYGDLYDDPVRQVSHGTHVCGSIVGSPDTAFNYGDFPKYNGVAYNSKVAFFDIQTTGSKSLTPPGDINLGLFVPMYQVGARIMSNSWGVGDPRSGLYQAYSVNVDTFMWNHPDALVFFAAGNSGGTATGVPMSVTPPSTNKNGVCVGATLSDHRSWLGYTAGLASSIQDISALAYFSSRGPTADGRLKPDVVAPGYYTTSANGLFNASSQHCSIRGLSGTSQATPTAAGAAVLVRQYFIQGFYPTGVKTPANGFTPSGALLKAVLVSASRAISIVPTIVNDVAVSYVKLSNYPDNNQGYGRIELDKTLHFAQSGVNPISLFVVGAATNASNLFVQLKSRQYHVYTFVSDSNASPLRITLAFTDLPGIESSSISNVIRNRLSLNVHSSSGTSYSPYVTGQNVQVIDIASPTASTTYYVNVSAQTLSATQPYALVVTGKVTYLSNTYGEIADFSFESNLNRVKMLKYGSVSTGAGIYIAFLSVIAAALAVAAVYLYCKIREKQKQDRLEDDPDLALGIQQSLRETGQRSRNSRGSSL